MPERLTDQEVHVWWVDLDLLATVVHSLAASLSPDERQRADRFVRDEDTRRFIVSHAALRAILGQYLGIQPCSVAFAISEHGKPELASMELASGLRFNLSHSGEMAMVAVVMGRDVGIDVEHVRPMSDVAGIINRFFSTDERAAWQSFPENERARAFFRCWTRKEAYLKARGVGLSFGLDRFSVSLDDVPVLPPIRVDEIPDDTAWHVYDVSPCENYAAACVTFGPAAVRAMDWTAPVASTHGRS